MFTIGDRVWIADVAAFGVVSSDPLLRGHWGRRQCYEVRLDDGRTIVADEQRMEEREEAGDAAAAA